MTLFIAISALLATAAVALLAWPLVRPASAGAGALPRRDRTTAAIVAAAVPLLAFAGYFWTSDWSWDRAEHAATDSVSAPGLAQMVEQLRSRLASQPDDVEGWKLLGRSATVIGDYPLARDAFSEAYTRSRGQDADAVAGFAESLVLNDEREIDGQAASLFEQALAVDPDNARALWYGGIIAFRRGDLALARQRWVELQNHELPPDLQQVVAERLAEIDRAQGGAPATAAAAAPAPSAGTANLTIAIAPALADKVPPGSTLFVIARSGEGGPPLAVVRRAVDSWPVGVSMTDANAMLPGTSLAAAGPLRLVARISRQGGPVAASGDLYGEVGYDFASASPVTVTIDRIVP